MVKGDVLKSKKETPQNAWNRRNGWVSKSYHLKESIVSDFADACEKSGVSQAGQLAKMMKAYIESVNKEINNNERH